MLDQGSTSRGLSSGIDRPPDWRVSTAFAFAAQGRLPLSTVADSYVRQLSTLAVRQTASPSKIERDRLVRTSLSPALAEAWQLAAEPSRTRASKLEALVLAGLTISEVASWTALSRATVDAYEQVFFDVNEKRADKSYIYAHAIRPELRRGAPADARRRYAVKVIAYYCGFSALRVLYPSRFTSMSRRKHPLQLLEIAEAERELDDLVLLLEPESAAEPVSRDDRQARLDALRRRLAQLPKEISPAFAARGKP